MARRAGAGWAYNLEDEDSQPYHISELLLKMDVFGILDSSMVMDRWVSSVLCASQTQG
jgi:hypothetical protein